MQVPDAIITGGDYPASADNKQKANVVGYIQMILIVSLMGGEFMLGVLGVPVPAALKTFFENRFIYAFLAFFVGAQI